jgi:hypothetical protein
MDVAIPIGREFHFAARFMRRPKNRLQMRGRMIPAIEFLEHGTSVAEQADGSCHLNGLCHTISAG